MNESERRHEEARATALFIGTALVGAVTVGSMRISGWSGGVLDNRIEPVFWAGAIFAGVGVILFGIAAMSAGTDDGSASLRIRRLLRAGLVLFISGPILCVTAVFVDYWI
jgi:hypothetical protein